MTSPASLQKRRDNHCHKLREDKAIHQNFIRDKELVTRLHHAGDELYETLFNAMVFHNDTRFLWRRRSSILKRVLWKRGSVSRALRRAADRDDVEELQHIAISAKNAYHHFGIHSSFKSHHRKTFSMPSSSKSPRLCFVCNKPEHLTASCYKNDIAVCSICKTKGNPASACNYQ